MDWADRFPRIVEAASRISADAFLLDGEAIVCGPDGRADFEALRSRRHDHDVVLFAFDSLELKGEEWRRRQTCRKKEKKRLVSLLARASGGIQFTHHLTMMANWCSRTHAAWGWKASSRSASTPRRSQRALQDVAQVQEPSERSSSKGARGRLELMQPNTSSSEH
jgi:hypothetical protein